MKYLIVIIAFLSAFSAQAGKNKMECQSVLQDHIHRLEKIHQSYQDGRMRIASRDYLIKLNDQTVAQLIEQCQTQKVGPYENIAISWDDYSRDHLLGDEFALKLYDNYAKVRDELLHGTERVD